MKIKYENNTDEIIYENNIMHIDMTGCYRGKGDSKKFFLNTLV